MTGHEVVEKADVKVVPETDEYTPSPRIHRKDPIVATSHVTLGVDPRMSITWNIPPEYFKKRCRLLVFRSTTGFCPEEYPQKLTDHGTLIVETVTNASYSEQLAEGSYYYTMVLHRPGIIFEKFATLRFSETVPTAKIAIGRIKDRIELTEQAEKLALSGINREVKVNDAKVSLVESRRRLERAENPPAPVVESPPLHPEIAKELEEIDRIVDGQVAKREKLNALKKSDQLKCLSPQEKDAVLKTIEERMEVSELSAAADLRHG